MHRRIIILYGPTGVGKSDYALSLGERFPLEIVNADVGQFYTPLSIGTAKPNWKQEKVPHHLFDILSEPIDYSVHDYRKAALTTCEALWAKGMTPLFVGGSGFYLKSLFFPPQELKEETKEEAKISEEIIIKSLWDKLAYYDKKRAEKIHQHDHYRINRALQLIQKTGSAYALQPSYQDLGISILFIFLTRERGLLYERINQRTAQMLQSGWFFEVATLQKTNWIPFLKRKKLIGYDDIITICEKNNVCQPSLFNGFFENEKSVEKIIAQKTRRYAKRQITFWRMLKKELMVHFSNNQQVHELIIINEKKASEDLHALVKNFLEASY